MILFATCQCDSRYYQTDTEQNLHYCYQCGQLVFDWGDEQDD